MGRFCLILAQLKKPLARPTKPLIARPRFPTGLQAGPRCRSPRAHLRQHPCADVWGHLASRCAPPSRPSLAALRAPYISHSLSAAQRVLRSVTELGTPPVTPFLRTAASTAVA